MLGLHNDDRRRQYNNMRRQNKQQQGSGSTIDRCRHYKRQAPPALLQTIGPAAGVAGP
jgi:hypothetical protein